MKTDSNLWIIRLSSYIFDNSTGQTHLHSYPNIHFNKDQEESISLLAFPESSVISSDKSYFYFFVLREEINSTKNKESDLYCYTIFKQWKDEKMERGYKQMSIVLISKMYTINLFQSLVEIISQQYFSDISLEKIKVK